MNKYAVIVAGGKGQRMGASTPKQFLLLKGRPLLWYTLKAFLHAYEDLLIILVLPAGHIEQADTLINDLGAGSRIMITEGGDTRFDSVRNGLKLVNSESVVFVHDGVRCLVSTALIQRCYEQALEKGSAIPAVAATDSIRIASGDSHAVADRNNVRIVQTPQTFLSSILLPAFEMEYRDDFTDEATVVEASGKTVYLVEGDYQNIKVTRSADLAMAAQLLD